MRQFVLAVLCLALISFQNPIVHAAPKAKKEAPRFVDRGEYVEDTTTGLLWQKDGNASGKRNFKQAADYAKSLKLGRLTGWRVPTRAELEAIFPATEAPFKDTPYTEQECCAGAQEFASYWTSELEAGEPDSAWCYHWYAKGGANNCFASKNFLYVRCVRGVAKAR